MTDLEIAKRCAKAMGFEPREVSHNVPEHTLRCYIDNNWTSYWPFKDDLQVIALIKKLELNLGPTVEGVPEISGWFVSDYGGEIEVFDPDFNRAVCLCVAKIVDEGKA